MKNKFIRLFASLCFTLFLVSCNQIVPEDEPKSELKEGNVIISLKQNPAKTISPVLDGFSYLDVNEWTVTFRETSGKYKDITESFREGTLSVKIPVGKFDVILEGSIPESENLPTSIPYSYYGKSSFEITGDEKSPVPVSVVVSPKKTTEGKGSFNYTLNIASCPAGAELTSKLVPYGTSEKKDEIVLETTPNSITEPTSGTNEFTITGSDIPSGFYKLSILLTVAADSYSKDIFSTFDNLVEILDNIETSGSKDVTFVDEVDKTYYVTCSESAKGNGVFESMPGYYDRIFETNDTVATVNLKFVDDILNQPCPQIDVSKLQNKTYNLFNKDTLIYSISKDIETGINISENNENKENYKINLIDSVKLAAGENTVVNYNGGNTLHLILGGGVSVKAPEVSGVLIYANEYNDYYAITKNPLVISSSKELRVMLNDGKGSEDFTILKKASTEEVGSYNYYFVKVNDTGVSLSSNEVPVFTIVDKADLLGVSDKTYYAGDTVTLKANASASFADGTTFIWYINGIEQTSTTDELSLTFGEGDTASNNSVLCIASYNGEYRSVAVDIKAIEQVALLYSTNPYHTTTASFSIVSDTTTSISKASGEIISGDGDTISVIDSYIDSNQNIYTLYTNNGSYYYSKSVFTGVGYETPAKVYAISSQEVQTFQEIKLGDNGTVYLLGQEGNYYKIWSITNSDSSDAGGTTSLTEELYFGKEVFTNSSRTTFFVDENSDIYYIKETITTDQDTSTTTNKVELVKSESVTDTENIVCTIFEFSFSSGDIISTRISNSDTMITFEYANGISYCPEFTDMRIINGKLYLLVRHLSKTSGNSYSTGCVICVDLLSRTTTVSGWDNNKYNSGSYSHADLTFYGPDKIVAIKPKKLLIADDGVEHGSSGSAKDKQRLVVFDLESNTITGTIEIPEGIEFSYYGNGYSFFN